MSVKPVLISGGGRLGGDSWANMESGQRAAAAALHPNISHKLDRTEPKLVEITPAHFSSFVCFSSSAKLRFLCYVFFGDLI